MLACDDCEYLKEIIVVVHGDGSLTNRCDKIPVNQINESVTTHDEDGEHPFVIINNPYKFGCLLHSKLKEYYDRITREDLIPDDKRISSLVKGS